MNVSLIPCDEEMLHRSLEQQLSEVQEEMLAQHLSQCPACTRKLEAMAAAEVHWQQIGQALREESIDSLSDSTDDDFRLKPSDFIVDFLKPSQTAEGLGRIGNIEIREYIGQGAHGVVLKGFQEELNRLVAVKVMAPHLASVVAARKRFAREARATAAIVHPNVLPILQVDSTGHLPYLVMPYVDCETLQDRLDRESSLPIAEVLRIGLQVARGLAAAHAQGLVHRDVKPANILLERGLERVMLTDFGLARAVDDATLTRSGLIAGTPHYMSPEQARGDAIGTCSDLFSLGSVLYAMMTGRPPFRAESTYGILRRVTDDQPRSPRELNADIPSWLEAITLRLLSKSAAERFPTADEVAKILEDCLAHLQQPNAFPLPTAAKLAERAWTKSHGSIGQTKRAVGVAAGLIGLPIFAVVCAMIWNSWNGTNEPNPALATPITVQLPMANNISGEAGQMSSTESLDEATDSFANKIEQLDSELDQLYQRTLPESDPSTQLPSPTE